jgi:hypothetical protein
MPEMYFRVRSPDGETQQCYSPSVEAGAAAFASVPGAAVTVMELAEAGRRLE